MIRLLGGGPDVSRESAFQEGLGNFQEPKNSSRNKLPFMILNPRSELPQKMVFLKKDSFSCRKMPFPTEKCAFLQKKCLFLEINALSCRKLQFSGADGRKPQEIAGYFHGSIIKNASQLSREKNTLKKKAYTALLQ